MTIREKLLLGLFAMLLLGYLVLSTVGALGFFH